MSYYDELRRKRLKHVKDAEEQGRVADSLSVRIDLINKMKNKQMSLEEMQSELKRIKRNAKKNGQITRKQAYRFK